MCQENQAIVWYNGQSCITLFLFWGTGCARRNVGKFVPYLYRNIFNYKVEYLDIDNSHYTKNLREEVISADTPLRALALGLFTSAIDLYISSLKT